MFATLAGPLPAPPGGESGEGAVREWLRAQEESGLAALHPGVLDGGGAPTETWRFAASCTDVPVKAVVLGPWTRALASSPAESAESASSAAGRDTRVLEAAEALRADILALAGAGCPMVQVDEPAATAIGDDDRARAVFVEAHGRLLDGVTGTHVTLAIAGGSADGTGAATIFGPPYQSYLFDLLAGPDNWRLIAEAPADRGIIAGVADARTALDDTIEVMVWAAHYAASTGGRGLERVGLATSGSLAGLSWDAAVAKMGRLAEAARVAALPAEDLVRRLDPRAVDIRSAAMGRFAPGRGPRPRP